MAPLFFELAPLFKRFKALAPPPEIVVLDGCLEEGNTRKGSLLDEKLKCLEN